MTRDDADDVATPTTVSLDAAPILEEADAPITGMELSEDVSGTHWMHGMVGSRTHTAFCAAQNASPPPSHSSPLH